MKALSLTQPWATLVAIGAKRIETRSWGTGHRGPLAIHAAKGFGQKEQSLCFEEPFRWVLKNFFGPDFAPGNLPTGAVVGLTEVIGCKKMTSEWIETIGDPERAFGLYEPGRSGWLLGPATWLPEPIPVKGALGLWEFEYEPA